MSAIANYQILEKLYESHHSKVCRAVSQENGEKVILKFLNKDFPTAKELSKFRREYKVTQQLQDVDGVIDVHKLITLENSLVMVEEDIGGESLASQLDSISGDLEKGLGLALRICRILGKIHENNIVHKDINPTNIIWNPATDELKIIDFGISSLLAHEYHEFQNPSQLEGSLFYISPEQTGRVNRLLDYRSDLYSLGVMLYEMLTGSLPFKGKDNIEWVHAHIALSPPNPRELNPQIPPALSQIVLKLLAKIADQRYQSCAGLEYDLERCIQQIEDKQSDLFTLGEKDHSLHFQIPQKLYGREKEIRTILDAFDRTAHGNAELLLVSGFSGIGKSALVNEVHLPLTKQQGYFVDGKFDQYQRDVPFYAWIQALEEFISLLLKEDDRALAKWKSLIQNALGNIGKVITDLLPSLELIIGTQPDIPRLTGEQALNRFSYAFKEFIKAIATAHHPLVIFIDDWQWADSASMTLLKFLMSDQEINHLLLIGAYRDNEVDTTHPFKLTLDEIEHYPARITDIQLQNLQREDVHALVSDALLNPPGVDTLVDLVFEKTQGNAFFLIQFLTNLYKDSLIHFDSELDCWMWKQAEVETKDITDNVVVLMAAKIRQFPEDTQNALKFGACIGSRFDLATLAILMNLAPSEAAAHLEVPLREGIIKPLDLNYRYASVNDEAGDISYQFIHDRVQQAAYGLIDAKQRETVHLEIAYAMLDKLSEADQNKYIFNIVNHFNIGKVRIKDAQQRAIVAKLNIDAGIKAKCSTAYAPALHYFMQAFELLGSKSWQDDHAQSAELHLLAAEVGFLTKRYDDMENWLDAYLANVTTPLERIRSHEIRLQAYTAQNRLDDAVDVSLEALALLGIHLPKKPNQLQVLGKLLKTKKALKGKSFEDLYALPPMKDPHKLAAMNLLGLTIPPAYWSSPDLVALIVFQMTQESVAHGYSSISGYGFSWWGITQCALLGNIDDGYAFGEFGVKLAKARNLNLQQPVFFFGWIIRQFKHHISESIDILSQAYQMSLEKGDFEYASYSLNNIMQAHFHCAKPLNKLLPKMTQAHRDLETFQVGSSLFWHDVWWQTALNFSEDNADPSCLEGSAYRESRALSQHLKVNDVSTLFLLYCAKLMLCVYFRDTENGFEFARKAREYLKGGAGMFAYILFHYYESLILLAYADARPGSLHARLLYRVKRNQKKLKNWAKHAPDNHLHRWNLVQAELCRVTGKRRQGLADKALTYYETAIDLAKTQGFVQDQALAYELATDYFHHRNQQRLTLIYLRQADYLYSHWGASNKVAHLKTHYHRLYPLIAQEKTPRLHDSRTTTHPLTTKGTATSQPQALDLDISSIVKASQVISGEIVFDELIKTLLTIAVENAGAQKGVLLNIQEDEINIEAVARIEHDEIRVDIASESSDSITNMAVPESIIQYVNRRQEALVIDNAGSDSRFAQDTYISTNAITSVLCDPIVLQGRVVGIVYLENNLAEGVFTPERLEVIKILNAQAAISMENARNYQQLEDKVAERTQKLEAALNTQERLNEQLLNSSVELKEAHTRLHEANLQLKKQANTDGLTELANRRFFDERLDYEINRCGRESQSLAVLMCDIDNFKSFNDDYGHVEGDDCLKRVAMQFNEIFHRATDLPARYGGEEFAVILPATTTDEATEIAEQLRAAVEDMAIPHKNNNGFDTVTISVGCYACVPTAEQSAQVMIDRADKALYQAKKQGRNRVHAYGHGG